MDPPHTSFFKISLSLRTYLKTAKLKFYSDLVTLCLCLTVTIAIPAVVNARHHNIYK